MGVRTHGYIMFVGRSWEYRFLHTEFLQPARDKKASCGKVLFGIYGGANSFAGFVSLALSCGYGFWSGSGSPELVLGFSVPRAGLHSPDMELRFRV